MLLAVSVFSLYDFMASVKYNMEVPKICLSDLRQLENVLAMDDTY